MTANLIHIRSCLVGGLCRLANNEVVLKVSPSGHQQRLPAIKRMLNLVLKMISVFIDQTTICWISSTGRHSLNPLRQIPLLNGWQAVSESIDVFNNLDCHRERAFMLFVTLFQSIRPVRWHIDYSTLYVAHKAFDYDSEPCFAKL